MSTTSLPILENHRPSLLDVTDEDLRAWLAERSQPAFRAKQIREWLLKGRVRDFEQMRNLPKTLRHQLSEDYRLFPSEIERAQRATDRTEKLLLKLDDGQFVECVLMREPNRNTVCISTQVGCGMGCVFCASGMNGLKRNLKTSEIAQQILLLSQLQDPNEKITNIVVMGIGEPLANLPQLLPALELVQDEKGLGLGSRRITISTVGLPDKIVELANYGKPYNLAVSLHAPNDELRTRIVPVNAKIGLEAVLAAADEFFRITGRRVTYEYVMLAGRNDQPHHARELARLLRRRNAHVNLIPMNGIDLLPYDAPTKSAVAEFVRILEASGMVATVRKRKGEDIDAACGQLRLKQMGTNPVMR